MLYEVITNYDQSPPPRTSKRGGEVVTETVEERLGESWESGTIVLAWDSIRELCEGRSGGLSYNFV